MKLLINSVLLVIILIFPNCEEDDPQTTVSFSLNDLVKSWEIVSVGNIQIEDHHSIWTFKMDFTYSWYDTWTTNLSGSGTYKLEGGNLILTGTLPDNEIVPETLHLNFTKDKTSFSFQDIDNNTWVYRIAETEKDYSRSIPFFEQENYTQDCSKRPTNSVCLQFRDDYIWLVHEAIGLNLNDYYTNGNLVQVRTGVTLEYHHVLGTNFVKMVPL